MCRGYHGLPRARRHRKGDRIHIRQQLFNGGNFYWGKWSNDGKDLEAVECLSAARVALDNKVGLKCKFILCGMNIV